MLRILLCVLAVLFCFRCEVRVQAATHAVLVAGSVTYDNYRHQADIAHAYQILIKHGVSRENIIVMMANDVVNHTFNPFPGKLFNHPTDIGVAGRDVYHGIRIDYENDTVSPENFLHVLTGNASAIVGGSGRVLNSTSEDDVFINFADHGLADMLMFPYSTLHRDDLLAALHTMRARRMYRKLVLYVEACYSGSLFEQGGLPTNASAYALTAANPTESSYAYYCEDESPTSSDMVNGTSMGTCLGDAFSVSWMENTDSVQDETLARQFSLVRKRTFQSTVSQYGSLSFTADSIFEFEGDDKQLGARRHLRVLQRGAVERQRDDLNSKARAAAGVRSADVPLHNRYNRYMRTRSARDAQVLIEELQSRVRTDAIFEQLAHAIGGEQHGSALLKSPARRHYGRRSRAHTECYRSAVQHYQSTCGTSDYGLQYMHVLHNICGHMLRHKMETSVATHAISKLCV